MGYDKNRLNTGLLALRVESGRLLTPASVAAELENFEVTVEGTLHSVAGPAPVLPQYTPMAGYFNYGRTHGVYHGLLMEGSRDVLLVHSEDSIRVFKGWLRTWETLIGPSGSGAQIEVDLFDTDVPQAPTQFTQTTTGIIIVPQNRARAYFYDGETVLPLGYDRIPSAPIGFGPTSTFDPTDVTNNLINVFGFMGSGSTTSPPSYASSDDFGLPQVGTIIPDATGTQLGVLGASRYQAAIQWVDYFGNLSPVSPRSNIVSIDSQNLPLDTSGGAGTDTRTPDQWLRAFFWSALSIGPQGTVGRVFCHTKDMVHSGTSALFEVSGNMMGATSGSYATFPDNTTNVYQYNRPDSELITSPPQPIPVPIFRLCAVALGRLWIGGIEGNSTAVIPSMPGRWGTFLRDSEYFPDPTGGMITALFPIREGLLVFTATSTFLMVASDDGQSFKAMPLSNTVGCVAPSSLVTLQDESTVWLGRDGFYQFESDKGVHSLSLEIEDTVKRINPVRAKQACAVLDPRSHEYRCWVALDGGRDNDFCFVFDPISQGWRRRPRRRPGGVLRSPGAVHPARPCGARGAQPAPGRGRAARPGRPGGHPRSAPARRASPVARRAPAGAGLCGGDQCGGHGLLDGRRADRERWRVLDAYADHRNQSVGWRHHGRADQQRRIVHDCAVEPGQRYRRHRL